MANAPGGEPGGTAAPIERRSGLPYAEFVDTYVSRNAPVIVTDAIGSWPALARWTPGFFRSEYGDTATGLGGLTLRELIDLLERPIDGEAPPYLRNRPIDRDFPELKPDISPLPDYLRPNWFDNPLVPSRISNYRTDLFIGGRGAGFPYLHYDNYHGYAFIFQIYGDKDVLVVPPEQSAFVYPQVAANGVGNVSAIRDVDNPDLERFPMFACATPSRCTLGPGEMLFVPSGWWHTTKMPGLSISVSSNIANGHNWGALMSDVWNARGQRPLRAVGAMPYLATIWAIERARDAAYRSRRLRGRDADGRASRSTPAP